MNTPVCDFVRRYAQSGTLRLHMPGHKGSAQLGIEHLDITEIDGADSLYEAGGVIRQSEENAGRLFGCRTFYSTEGSSQCIRAMLYLAQLHARETGKRPLIAAGRNAHKTFMSAAALMDLEVLWLYPEAGTHLSCVLNADQLEAQLAQCGETPAAVYITSPDYLGNRTDIAAIAGVCRKHGMLLLVDNAHGAYMKFLEKSLHPMDLGADLCCDSAHKTLPVLTGGAYLHIAPSAPERFARQAKSALAMFGSTSPSYLILQSLDAANAYLSGHRQRLQTFVPMADALKERLLSHGYCLTGDEPLKITIQAKAYGMRGTEMARALREAGIECEFSDPDALVLMLTPETGKEGLSRLEKAMLGIRRRPPIEEAPPGVCRCARAMSLREAMLSPAREIAACESEGRILASASVGCPPAVPIVICGERIDAAAVKAFSYYGVETCMVVDEDACRRK